MSVRPFPVTSAAVIVHPDVGDTVPHCSNANLVPVFAPTHTEPFDGW